MAVGIGLIIGLLTGFAAFFGALMNMSFLLAGSASSNPVLFTLAIGIMLAWKVAGYYGLDRYVLPMLGTPWHPGPDPDRRRLDTDADADGAKSTNLTSSAQALVRTSPRAVEEDPGAFDFLGQVSPSTSARTSATVTASRASAARSRHAAASSVRVRARTR